MSVYVDEALIPFGRMLMSHMVADSTDELVAMADRIGVRRRWIQRPGTWREHFDISREKRALAIAAGALPVEKRWIAAFMRKRREQEPSR